MCIRLRIGWILPLLVVLAALLGACGLSESYEVKGRVVGFGDDGRTLIVEHEDIPGLMPAMTMPFKAQQDEQIEQLDRGDAVRFTFVVTRDRSWIHDIEKLPHDAVAEHPAGTGNQPTVPEGTPVLQPGDEVPAFTLTSQEGEPVRLADYQGRALLVTFIYTRCPIPDYCPLMSQRFEQLQDHLGPRYGQRVGLLSISFDPAHDTPPVLKDYAQRYHQDPSIWTFATGTSEEIGRVAHLFGVFYEEQEGQLNHTLATALVTPEGRLRAVWRGNRWTINEVIQTVDEVLNAPEVQQAELQ